MSEQSPEMIDVSITMSGRIDAERLPELIEVIQQLSVVQLAMRVTAGGEQLEIPGTAQDADRVTLEDFTSTYLMHFGVGDTPSALPTRVFREVARAVDVAGVVRNRKGDAVAVTRDAFDTFIADTRTSKGPITGPKSKALLFGVARDLPTRTTED